MNEAGAILDQAMNGKMLALVGFGELLVLMLLVGAGVVVVSLVRACSGGCAGGSERSTASGGMPILGSVIVFGILVLSLVWLLQMFGGPWFRPEFPGPYGHELQPRGFAMSGQLIPIIFIIVAGVVALSFLKMLAQAFGRRQERRDDPEETRLIQEMHQNLTRLEDRIEALETLIVDREQRVRDQDD